MIRNKIKILLFVIGFVLLVYPMSASFINDLRQGDIVGTYENKIEKMDLDQSLEMEIKKAEEYNNALFDSQNGIVSKTDILTEESYKSIYDITETGIMGSLEIPKISLKLPIYHGTDDMALAAGLGHMKESCFPIGGINTKSVITGHRGLPDANLFLRLDEVKENDVFYIKIGRRELAYKVKRIEVVEPEDNEVVAIEEGSDLVSLVTCTPYGINTKRLVVTGERFFEEKGVEKELEVKSTPSKRRIIMNLMPFIFLAVAVVKLIKHRWRRD